MPKTVLITGTSSGIGRAAVEHFTAAGWNVAATMRDPSCEAGVALAALPNVVVFKLDVTSASDISAAVSATVARFGSLFALVNNAGYGLVGPMELATAEQIERQISTNLVGPIALMQAVLPHMRAARSGVIVNVTSVGGRYVMPFCSLYQSTKFGLEGLSEAVALELAPLGVRVRIVEPGGVRTDFGGRSIVVSSSESVHDYDKLFANAFASFDSITAGGSEPDVIAKVIYEAVTDESDKIRYPAGDDAHAMLKERFEMSDEEHQKKLKQLFNLVE